MKTEPTGHSISTIREGKGREGIILLFFILLVLGPVLPCHAFQITFRDAVTVSEASVTLADLADINNGSKTPELAKALAGQTVASSPEPGQKTSIDSRSIIHKLSQNMSVPEDTIQWSGAPTITVSRKGVTITASIIQNIIDDFLKEHSSDMPGIRCSFTPADPPLPFIVSSGELRWEVIPSNPNIIGSTRFSLIGRIDNQVVKNFSVRGTLEAMAPVAVSATNIRRDEIIGEAQIRMESRDISTLRTPCLQKDQVVNKKLLRSLKAGDVIELSSVEFPPLVKKGAVVKILVQKNGLELTATGIAKTDGKEGEIIKVKNISSEKEIFCRVSAPGLVEVQI